MEFRRLTSADLKSLLELYQQLDPDNPCFTKQSEGVWKEIEADANIRYYGAVEEGKVVSTCYAVYIPNLTRNHRGICFIENVVTDKAYRRLGLASGVYFCSFAKQLLAFAEAHLPENRDVFYLYTHGAPVGGFLKGVRRIVKEKRCRELGKYHCLGFDTFGLLGKIGGIAKGHPTQKEIAGAVKFYQEL